MNIRMRLVALIFILIAPTWAAAFKINDRVTLKELNPIYISITDGAKGGCWTNIGEAKTYLSDKLELEGAVLTDDKSEVFLGEGTAFSLMVNAKRHDNLGICYGSIAIMTQAIGERARGAPHRGLLHFSEKTFLSGRPINFNDHVLEVISDAVEEWR